MKNLKKSLSLLFFILGLFLFTLLVKKVGLENITASLSKLGWKIIFVFTLPIAWTLLQSLAWFRILKDDNSKISFFHVFLTKITGESINTITPVNFMGGDSYRIYLLQKKTTATASTASVVIDRTMQTLAIFILLLVSLSLAIFDLPLPKLWKIILPIFVFILIGLVLGLIRFQKRGIFTFISSLFKKIGFKKDSLEKHKHKIEEIDLHIRNFYQKHKYHFFEILTLHFLGRFLGPIEIYMIGELTGLNIPFIYCIYLASLTILINMLFVFIPGSIGVMEGGYGGLFYILKLDPAYGVTLQLIRRIRALFWVFIGLLIILVYRPKKDSIPA